MAKATGTKLREIIEDNQNQHNQLFTQHNQVFNQGNQDIDSLIKNKIMKKKEKIKSNLMNFSNPGNINTCSTNGYYKLHLETSQAYQHQPSLFKQVEEKKTLINLFSHKRSSSTYEEETPPNKDEGKKSLVSPRLEKLISKYGDFFEKKDSVSNKSKQFNNTGSFVIKNSTNNNTQNTQKDIESYRDRERESIVVNLKSSGLKQNSNYKTITTSKTSAGTKTNSRKNSLDKIVFKNAINVKDVKITTKSSTNNSISNLLSGKFIEKGEAVGNVNSTNNSTTCNNINKLKISHSKMLSEIPALSSVNMNMLNNYKKEKSIKSINEIKGPISSSRKIEVNSNLKKKQIHIPLADSLKNSLGRLEDFASVKDPNPGSAMSVKKFTPITTSHSPSHIFTNDMRVNFKENKNSTPISPKSKFIKKETNMKNLDLGKIINQQNQQGIIKASVPSTSENRLDKILDNSTDSIRSTMREKDFFRKESERIVQYIRQCKNTLLL